MKKVRVLFNGLLVIVALVALNRCGTKATTEFGETTFFPNISMDAIK